jgi:membrane protein implicated in regulation of membrane protease activity
MENIGALTGLEQIFLNALFAGIGAIIGTGTALLSPGQSSLQVQVVFWASLAVSAVVLVCFIVVKKKRDKLKNDITG